jgi:hypothetical protein
VAGRSLLVGVEGGSRGVRMSACNNGLVEAFIVVKECNSLKPVWDGRSLWSPRFERAVFDGCLLGKMEISFLPEFR